MDAAGPLMAFETAGQCGAPGYTLEIAAMSEGLVTSSGGVAINAMHVDETSGCDILLIPGGLGVHHRSRFEGMLDFVRETHASGRRVVSVCSGAFILAAAGLLHNRTAATHWAEAPELARLYPDTKVDGESLFVRDGNIWTSAGISAGVDLAIALIESDYGAALAKRVAQMMVVPFRRSGTQSQHSALLDLVSPDHRFNEILAWARNHLAEPLTLEVLAGRSALSVRQFARAFTSSIGTSPAKAIERLRLEAARASLETGTGSLEQIARASGFGNPDHMRRAFIRVFGEPPRSIRRKAPHPSDRSRSQFAALGDEPHLH